MFKKYTTQYSILRSRFLNCCKKLTFQIRKFGQYVIDWIASQPDGNTAEALSKWAQGEDIIFRGAPSVLIALTPSKEGGKGPALPLAPVDGSIALATVELIAPSLGLGTCWAGRFQRAAAAWAPLQAELKPMECVGAVRSSTFWFFIVTGNDW